ncbi:MAG: ester cyclase [Chloroflexi bacterium]|nr:ester cyclase [Chloroflexota bacterium]
MSQEGNKIIVRRFITEVLDKGNMSVLDQLCAPNYVNRATGQGVDSLKQLSGLMKTAIPNFHLTVENLVAEGDEVVARFTYTGTYTGSVMGSKPTGKTFSVRGMTYYRLADGKIVEDDPISNQDLSQLLGIPLPMQNQV